MSYIQVEGMFMRRPGHTNSEFIVLLLKLYISRPMIIPKQYWFNKQLGANGTVKKNLKIKLANDHHDVFYD